MCTCAALQNLHTYLNSFKVELRNGNGVSIIVGAKVRITKSLSVFIYIDYNVL